jgi:RNA-binding protein
MPMTLKESQKKYLRGLGHQLKPMITVGDNGLTETLLAEYESTLAHHELIKARIRAGDREARDDIIRELCGKGSAELIQRIGNVALLYRENPENKKIRIPQSLNTTRSEFR